MKFSKLSEKRQVAIRKVLQIDVDNQDNIVYSDSISLVPDNILHNFFEFSNI